MSIWAISDLHLSFDEKGILQKPMDSLNSLWYEHTKIIEKNWRKNILPHDTVLICGDISWAMDLEEGKYDFDWLKNLPGKKIISKGNHDYWWKSLAKVEHYFNKEITALQNNAVLCENYAICATRGWDFPKDNDEKSQKIFNRELMRLELSLKKGLSYNKDMILMLHYPPFNEKIEENPITKLLKNYPVKKCIFGHLHEKNILEETFVFDGITYDLVSADRLNFNPIQIS